MRIIDTNILYYKHQNPKYIISLSNGFITSINALEFLKNIEKKHTNRAKYYIPLISQIHLGTLANKFHKNRPFNKRLSDNIAFDFKRDFESYVLYNNHSICKCINENSKELFYPSIEFLAKENFKEIKDKFNFLLESKLTCLQIDNRDIDLSYSLLDLFLKNHSIKEDFRNSWNDLLILSKSINTKSILVTKDKLLNKFAAEIYDAKVVSSTENEIEIDFRELDFEDNKYRKFESKGYINRGWQYKMNK